MRFWWILRKAFTIALASIHSSVLSETNAKYFSHMDVLLLVQLLFIPCFVKAWMRRLASTQFIFIFILGLLAYHVHTKCSYTDLITHTKSDGALLVKHVRSTTIRTACILLTLLRCEDCVAFCMSIYCCWWIINILHARAYRPKWLWIKIKAHSTDDTHARETEREEIVCKLARRGQTKYEKNDEASEWFHEHRT